MLNRCCLIQRQSQEELVDAACKVNGAICIPAPVCSLGYQLFESKTYEHGISRLRLTRQAIEDSLIYISPP